MDVSCSPPLSADFDFALALLHNFWYARALEAFNKIIQADPQCAMAYWGAAMTYNHPFWDAPTREDEAAAWALAQKGIQATKKTIARRCTSMPLLRCIKTQAPGRNQSATKRTETR